MRGVAIRNFLSLPALRSTQEAIVNFFQRGPTRAGADRAFLCACRASAVGVPTVSVAASGPTRETISPRIRAFRTAVARAVSVGHSYCNSKIIRPKFERSKCTELRNGGVARMVRGCGLRNAPAFRWSGC